MNNSFVCPICGNDDPNKIGYLNGKPYCRNCITFPKDVKKITHGIKKPIPAPIHLEYELSDEQLDLSRSLIENYQNGINSLVHAVCGSGKTEITLNIIKMVIEQGGTVGFAIPRRDVVIEIKDRLASIFSNNIVVSVYGGHTEELEGDIICLTTHQLFRYDHYFDLLIIDEIDAFPYKGSAILEKFFIDSVCGNYIQMSATPSSEVLSTFKKDGYDILELFTRFHRFPLPVPIVKKRYGWLKFIELLHTLKRFIKAHKPVFVFCPTIEACEKIYSLLKLFISSVNYIHSKKDTREKTISDFKKGAFLILVTTAVLERGVTIKDLQVIVYNADHKLYDSYALVQISGRVGRKKDAPKGEVIYIANYVTKEMEKSIEDIKSANKHLQTML